MRREIFAFFFLFSAIKGAKNKNRSLLQKKSFLPYVAYSITVATGYFANPLKNLRKVVFIYI